MSATNTLPSRSEIPDKYKWDDTSVFANQEAWQKEYDLVGADLFKLEPYRGHLGDSPQMLVEGLELLEALHKRVNIVHVYASMSHAVNTQDQNAAAMNGRVLGLAGRAGAAFSFLDPELISIGQAKLQQWMDQEPRLKIYAHYFDNLFRKQAHVRSAEVEEILGMLADPFSGAYTSNNLLTSADMRFSPAVATDGSEREVAQGTYHTLLGDPDRQLRKTDFEHYRDVFLAFKNTSAAQLETSVKQNVFNMRARRFDSTLAMALHEQNLPVEVYHNLIANFVKNLPTWHRYWRVRKKALGVPTLHTYDIWAPLTKAFKHIPYEEAVDWICAGLAPMGKEYVEIVRHGSLDARWVDAMPNRGKTEGAFSSGVPGTHPFILMSYDNDIGALSTLAHELGHSMHSYYTFASQPLLYTYYGNFVAEVASNFHQAMVRAYLLNEITDRDLRINLIEEAMSNFHRYFFIMPTLARFELQVHQRVERGEALTADELTQSCADLFAEGYGEDLQTDRLRDGITWATFGHLYADYYVFQYATGISGANALSKRILSGTHNAAQDYINFLKAGSGKYPLEALKDAGVDMASPAPVEAAFEVLANYVTQLEELVG